METRQEKDRYDMAIPEFKSEFCESCMKEAELINIGKVIKGRVNVKASYHVCLDCLKELHPVSGMTNQLKHEHEQRCRYAAYDLINYGEIVSDKAQYNSYIN